MTLQAGGNIGGQTPDVGSAAEVTVDTSSLGADLPTGGVRINFIPQGRRQPVQQLDASSRFTNEQPAGQQLHRRAARGRASARRTRSCRTTTSTQSFGGPFKRDKVWFWFSTRYNDVANEAPVFENLNAFKPNEWLYVPDTSQPGVNEGVAVQQQHPRHVAGEPASNKIAGTYKADKWCNCPNNISATLAPEAARDRRFPRLRQEHGEWTSPVTNRLLFEAVGMHLYERWGNMHLRVNGGSLDDPAQEAHRAADDLGDRAEQRPGLSRSLTELQQHARCRTSRYRAALAYVTGIARVQDRLQPHARATWTSTTTR